MARGGYKNVLKKTGLTREQVVARQKALRADQAERKRRKQLEECKKK